VVRCMTVVASTTVPVLTLVTVWVTVVPVAVVTTSLVSVNVTVRSSRKLMPPLT